MLKTMTTGGGPAATTALVAVGVILVLPTDREGLRPPAPAVVTERAEAPVAELRGTVPAGTRTLVEEASAESEAPRRAGVDRDAGRRCGDTGGGHGSLRPCRGQPR